MSYCRFGVNDSDLYIIGSSSRSDDRHCYICYCFDPDYGDMKESTFYTKESIVRHIENHITLGDKVPNYVIPEILADDWTD